MNDASPVPGIDVEDMIEGALEDAAQVLVGSDAPIASTDELIAAVQGKAVRAVLEARVEQIVTHGHDRDYDSMLGIGHLPKVARDMMLSASDLIDGSSERRNLPVARKRLARAAALCLAAIDRLDMVKGGGE